MLILQFDGLFREAPHTYHLGNSAGIMCYGWVIWRGRTIIARGHGGYVRGKEASSNVAEYLALIEGLEALLDMGAEQEEVLITGDAQSVIDQMQGNASVNAHSIRSLYRRARKLFVRFKCVDWCWTPRAKNQEADALTRRALRQLHAYPDHYEALLAALQSGKQKGGYSSRLTPIMDLRRFQTA